MPEPLVHSVASVAAQTLSGLPPHLGGPSCMLCWLEVCFPWGHKAAPATCLGFMVFFMLL